MATLEPVYAVSVMDSWKGKGCNGVPLPYLIRPRRIMPPIDTFAFYSSDDEGDEGDSSVKVVEASTLDKDVSSGHSDDEYVVVDKVEALPKVEALSISKTEKRGTIQMLELSKDTVDDDGSESEDAGYKSDDWVVV